MSRIHEIREKKHYCAFGCQYQNTNPFHTILSSKTPFDTKRRCLNGQIMDETYD